MKQYRKLTAITRLTTMTRLTASTRLAALAIALSICACSSQTNPSDTTNEEAPNTNITDNDTNDINGQIKNSNIQSSNQQNLTTIDTVHGPIILTKNPHPLVVYDLTLLQNLIALGVPIEGIPNKSVLSNTAKQSVANSKLIGTVFEPDLEALNEMQPQAILIGNRMSKRYDALSSIAPTLDLSVSFKDLYPSSQQQLEQLGKLFDKSKQVYQLQGNIDKAIKTTANMTRNKGNGLVISVKGNKITTFGVESRYGYLHKYFGIPIADPNIASYVHGQPISFEFIHKVNPDWLFLLEYHPETNSEGKNAYTVLDNALIHKTKAWRQQQIVYLSADSYLAFGSYNHWINDAKRIQNAFKDAPILQPSHL